MDGDILGDSGRWWTLVGWWMRNVMKREKRWMSI